MRTAAAVLAVDGGNSKTDLVLLDASGRLLAARRTGSTSHQEVGLDAAMQTLALAVEGVAHDAGLGAVQPLADMGVYCLAGLDLPVDDDLVGGALARTSVTTRWLMRNDTFAVLRAGTDAGWGVALVCGAGMNCVAAAPDGRSIRFPSLGAISGDGPDGGRWLGRQALGAAVRAEDGRGAPTTLSTAVPLHFGLDAPLAVTEAMYTGRLSQRRVVELAPVVVAAARDGDPVAVALLDAQADELVVLGRAALMRLGLQSEAVPIVLGGGVIRSGEPRFLDRIRSGLHDVAPRADVRFLTTPPVLGAALLGLDAVEASPDALATARRSTWTWDEDGFAGGRVCLDGGMTDSAEDQHVVSASREIAAPSGRVFELIADPAQQPRWDGNDNLAGADGDQRVRAVGDVFRMTLTIGQTRENHVVEFEEGTRIAWRPADPGSEPAGHLWRWELEPIDPSRTRVTHTYDWSELRDEQRFPRARATTSAKLQASLDRLAALAEQG